MRIVPDSFQFDGGIGQLLPGAVPGPSAPAPTTVTATTPGWMDILKQGAEAVKTGSEAYANIIRSRVKTPTTPVVAPTYSYQQAAPPPSSGLQTWHYVAIAGGGLVLIGLVYMMTRK